MVYNIFIINHFTKEFAMSLKETLEKLGRLEVDNTLNNMGPFAPQDPTVLHMAFATYSIPHTFHPGDIIKWKPGLKNRRIQGPVVVLEVLDEPFYVEKDFSTPNFHERLDIAIGVINITDGEFMSFYVDSRRFQPMEEDHGKDNR